MVMVGASFARGDHIPTALINVHRSEKPDSFSSQPPHLSIHRLRPSAEPLHPAHIPLCEFLSGRDTTHTNLKCQNPATEFAILVGRRSLAPQANGEGHSEQNPCHYIPFREPSPDRQIVQSETTSWGGNTSFSLPTSHLAPSIYVGTVFSHLLYCCIPSLPAGSFAC